MGLSPISRIDGVAQVKPKSASEVSAAIAVERSDRSGDDDYRNSKEESGRGMEEEDSDPAEDSESELTQSPPGSVVNLLA